MKEKSIKILQFLQMGIAAITFILVFFSYNDYEKGLILPENIKFLPVVFYSLFLGLFIVEFALKKSNIKAIFYYSEIIVLSYFLINSDYYLLNTVLMFLGISNLIITVFYYVKGLNNNKAKPLPIGFYSYAHFYGVVVPFSLLVGLIVILYFLFEKNGISPLWLLLFIPVIFVFGIIILIVTNPLIRTLKTINKELNYQKYSSQLDKLVPNNLHPESRAYLEVVRANYMLLENRDEALKYYESISAVTAKQFIIPYATVKANFAALKHDGAEFGQAIALIKANAGKRGDLLASKINPIWDVYNNKNEIQNVEEIFNVNEYLPIKKIINKNILMNYYYSRENKDKALYYANELKNCPFNQIKESANKIIEVEKNEEQA